MLHEVSLRLLIDEAVRAAAADGAAPCAGRWVASASAPGASSREPPGAGRPGSPSPARPEAPPSSGDAADLRVLAAHVRPSPRVTVI